MPRRLQPDQADVRQKILDAAMHEFSARGYDRATLDDIAAKAGVSKGAVYWYFDNKPALFLAVIEKEISKFTEYLEAVAAEEGQSVTARLKALIVVALTYCTDHPAWNNLLKVFVSPLGSELDKHLLGMAAKEYRRVRNILAMLLQEGVQRGEIEPRGAEAAAPMLVALFDGLMFQWLVDPKAVPLRKLAPHIAHTFLEGIVKR